MGQHGVCGVQKSWLWGAQGLDLIERVHAYTLEKQQGKREKSLIHECATVHLPASSSFVACQHSSGNLWIPTSWGMWHGKYVNYCPCLSCAGTEESAMEGPSDPKNGGTENSSLGKKRRGLELAYKSFGIKPKRARTPAISRCPTKTGKFWYPFPQHDLALWLPLIIGMHKHFACWPCTKAIEDKHQIL